MKKVYSALLALLMTGTLLAGCAKTAAAEAKSDASGTSTAVAQTTKGGDKLVVYTTETEELLNAIIPYFEKENNVTIELIAGGTGEILKRLDSEKENPLADILLGTDSGNAIVYADCFEEYVSPKLAECDPDYGLVAGVINQYKLGTSCFIINNDLAGDVEVTGWHSLLAPELKGMICTSDPLKSSSGFNTVVYALRYAGDVEATDENKQYESESAWKAVKQLYTNIDGKILGSSSAVHKGVAEGEYAIGLSYEEACLPYLANGANVRIVYPIEGNTFTGSSLALVKNGKNPELAKKFIDYCLSADTQTRIANEAFCRPIHLEAKLPEGMLTTEEINQKPVINWYFENKNELLPKIESMLTDLEG